ncbi:MAG: leucine-rich repeat protein [Sphingobacteriales bacterium]|nr:leucine-rich repeat protein [Sphingobacteriales bacterium]
MKIEFYIGTQLVDTSPDFNAQIVLGIETLDGVTSGAYGKRSIKLPYTKKNAAVFQQWAAPMQVEDAQYHLIARPCYIAINGITTFKGMAQLNGIDLIGKRSQRQGVSISVDLIGNNAVWIEEAKTKRVRDLGWYDADHRLTDVGVTAGITASDADIDTYGYTLIKFKEWANPNHVLIDEFTNFLFVKHMLKKFFDLYGYTILGNFFETDFAKRLIIPVPINPDTSEYSARHIMKGAFTTPQPFLVPDFTGAISVDPSSHYTPAQLGYYLDDVGTFTVTLKVTVTSVTVGAGAAEIGCFIGTTTPFVVGTVSTTPFPSGLGVGVFYSTVDIQVTAADLGQYLIPTVAWLPAVFDYFAEIEIIYLKQYLIGASIQFAEIIPKSWVISDLFKGLSECFNLVFDTDPEAQTVLIECRDDWYETQRLPTPQKVFHAGYYGATQKDRSLLRDFTKEAQISFDTPFRWYAQSYKADDPTVEALNATTVPKIYENISHLNEVGIGTEEAENSLFATTIHNPEPDIISPTSAVTPIVPMVYGVNHLTETTTDGSYNETPRLLFWAGQNAIYGAINVDFSGVITDTLLPCSFVFNAGDVSGGFDPCLAYSDQRLNNGNVATGLSNVFYPKEIARISQFYTLTEYILLSIIDIVNFKFNEIWYIDGVKYIPTKIEYNPLGTAAKVVLRPDADLPLPENQVPNLRIGGMAFGSAAAFQAFLIAKGNPTATVTSYTDNGDGTETFAVGGFTAFAAQTFENETDLTSFEDLTGWVTYLGANCFNACLNLTIFVADNVSSMANAVFIQTGLTFINLPNCVSMGIGVFASCPSLATIILPLCTNLGGTVGDDNVFLTINGYQPVVLTVPVALQTCDAGNPDGDIVYLLATNPFSTIIYV